VISTEDVDDKMGQWIFASLFSVPQRLNFDVSSVASGGYGERSLSHHFFTRPNPNQIEIKVCPHGKDLCIVLPVCSGGVIDSHLTSFPPESLLSDTFPPPKNQSRESPHPPSEGLRIDGWIFG